MNPPRRAASKRRRRSDLWRAQRRGARRAVEPANRSLPNKPLFVGSLIGMAIAGYLAVAPWVETNPAGCGVGSACDLVQSNRFASLLGIPVAAWSFALYAALVLVAVSVRNARRHSRLSLALSGTGLAVSLYLTAASVIELGGVCAWCIASLGAIAACFAITVAQRAQHGATRRILGLELGIGAVGSVVLVSVLHLYYGEPVSPTASADAATLRALALHLDATGARFYGASWCRVCAEQKALFGDAASLLPYVECSPEGRRGQQASSCREANVERYPTWIIGSHRHEGLLDVEALAALSSFSSAAFDPVRDEKSAPPARRE